MNWGGEEMGSLGVGFWVGGMVLVERGGLLVWRACLLAVESGFVDLVASEA